MKAETVAQPIAIQGLLALMQLERRAREAASVEELGFIAANETRTLLEYRQAALSLVGQGQSGIMVSGIAQPDMSAPYLQWLERLFKMYGQGLTEPRRLCAGDLDPVLAEEWGRWLPRDGLLIALTRPNGATLGMLLLAREGAWQNHELNLVAELGHVYGHALFALRSGDALWPRMRSLVHSRKVLLRIALALLVAACIPVRLSVLLPAEVTPLNPFVVRAPLEGIVDRFQVRPNESIAAGAPLFNLDATTLESRHATAREAYETAREEYRQSAQLAVTDDKAKLEMTLHKGALEQKAVDLDYTASQLERVQIKAPRAGVAVFSDVHEWIGRAVTIGEKVLVLADPAKVELTAQMPIGDQIDLVPGATIVFYPKATPFSSYSATIDSVAYHAETTGDNVLAYRIRAHFNQNAALPRLGLMGSARVYAQRVPIAYVLLRRPMATLRQWLGW